MSADIVERLRTTPTHLCSGCVHCESATEAADEIERLRAEEAEAVARDLQAAIDNVVDQLRAQHEAEVARLMAERTEQFGRWIPDHQAQALQTEVARLREALTAYADCWASCSCEEGSVTIPMAVHDALIRALQEAEDG